MPDNIRSTVKLFANDTIMYLTITSDVDTVHLQEDLDKLASWEQAWMMSFHPEKCNVLTVSRKRNIIKRDYILHGHQQEQVTSAKYLGVTISSDLRWNVHIANICKRANSSTELPQVRDITVFTVFRLWTDFVCLYTYEF
jgi:hypothetical protein